MSQIKQELRYEMANICVDHYAKDGLERGTLVRILCRWEEDLFPGEPDLGKIVKITVSSLIPPHILKTIDGTDVA